jgi:maleylpyruvate isomerase
MPVPAARLEQLRTGERFFLEVLQRAEDLSVPSELPGWSRATLVAHVARNADALGNLLAWARTGIETPMYASPEARAEGIERSAAQTDDQLRADVIDAADRLLDAIGAMPEAAWDARVKTARGRDIAASEVAWMRIRETWVHAVDLGAGAAFGDIPDAIVFDLVGEVASGLIGRGDCPAMNVDIGSAAWRVGRADGEAVEVRGPASDVLAWLIGRAPLADAPPAPAWL